MIPQAAKGSAALLGLASLVAALAVPAYSIGAKTTANATTATAASSPLSSPFYRYTGNKPLRKIKPGAVLKTRTVSYSLQGISTPLSAVQVLFRTTNAIGRPDLGVTTVVKPPSSAGTAKVVSYQSFYDSLNPADEPSAAIAGAGGLGDGIANAETGLLVQFLLDGFTVNIPDTEGQAADFAAGPEYGITTLDSLRAISRTNRTGVGRRSPIGLIGYSGGAIGTGWAAELAPRRAPSIAKRIVGSAMGGVLVEPDHNLHYIDGSTVWAGVMAMALVGVSRAYHFSLTKYMSPYGRTLTRKLRSASITSVLGDYPGLTFAKLTKPKYHQPESIRAFVKIANKLIMGSHGTPTAPMFIGQGTGGYMEGTSGSKPGIGMGDGVMIAGDVRTLAREYCARGVTVDYQQYPLSHVGTAAPWLADATPWLLDRFGGTKAPSSCGKIAVGNPLKPVTVLRPS